MKSHLLNNRKNIASSILIAAFISTLYNYPIILLAFAFALAFFLIDDRRIILCMIIISFLTIISEYFELYRNYLNLISILILFIIFLKVYGIQWDKYRKVPLELLYFLLLLFACLSFSTLFSFNFEVSLFVYFRTLVFFIIAYFFYALILEEKYLYGYIYSLFFSVIIFGIPMLIDLYNLGFQGYFMRILLSDKFDLLTSRGYTGVTLFFISSSLAVGFLYMPKYNKITMRLFIYIYLFFNLIILFLANSRGGLLAAIISTLFIIFILNKDLFYKVLYFLLFIILTFLLFPGFLDLLSFYLRWETVGEREVYWKMGVEMFNDHKLSGIGPALFHEYFFNYASAIHIDIFKTSAGALDKPHPHNFFLYFAAENGVLGLVTAIVFFILFFYLAIKTLKLLRDKDQNLYALSTAITGIGIGLFFRSFIEIAGFLTYGYITLDLPFWLVFAILIYIYMKYSSPGKFS